MSFTNATCRSISQSLASFAHLKALSLLTDDAEPEDIKPLAQIKNLKHFYLRYYGYHTLEHIFVQSMLWNSRSTLQSLAIETNAYACQFLRDWEKNGEGISEQGHDFTALKSLTLSGVQIDEYFIKGFQKAIDFTGLRELNLGSLCDTSCLFYPHLTSITTSYQGTKDTPLSLRSLSLRMSENPSQHNSATFAAKCRFISSFDTLTTLDLPNYGQYPSNTIANPGLTDTLLHAILKHKNLTTLKISYTGRNSGFETPYLSAKTVGAIIDGLPLLREFEFAPDEAQMAAISQVLLRGSNLQSITCFPHASWGIYPPPADPGANMISIILQTFLSNTKFNLTSPSPSANGKFVWENHYKLTRVSVIYKVWEVASGFGKRAKGEQRPEKIQADSADGPREVWYRSVTGPQRIHVGFDPEFEWADKVDREMQ